MRVLIDTSFARRGATGTGVYLRGLCGALRALDVEVLTAADDRRRPPAGGGIGSWSNLARDLWWTQVELPRRAHACRADVLHHPLPAHSRHAPCAQVVTVHDLSHERLPECFDPRFRAFAHFAHARAVRRADAVVCVSQTTARDVAARWRVRGERVVVAPHGPGQELASAVADDHAHHLLYVGDDEPRKNLALLLGAYRLYRETAIAPIPLVLAGAAGASAPGVSLERAPTAERLAALYGGAIALIAPSLHEGFGLPALEAMAAGTAVLAARTGAHVEVCADGARYFDPRDASDLAAAIAWVTTDDSGRAELIVRARTRAQAYSWERSARSHLRAYTLAAGHGGNT